MTTAHVSVQPGDSTDLSIQLLEKQPQITVDDDGGLFFMSTGHPGARALTSQLVGTIGGLTDPSVDTWSDDIAPPVSVLIPSEIEYRGTNRMSIPEPKPPSRSDGPQKSVSSRTQEVTAVAGPFTGKRMSHPLAGKSPEDVDSVKPRGDQDATTVSVLSLRPWCINNIPLADITTR